MPQMIASTYEIIRRIGSGGGGIVYLGQHKRLNKLVAIKEDTRPQNEKIRHRVNEEMLRREVDALKNLSHTSIPQVYDYVEEDGKVYTVMDYIEGESLDKPLERGEVIPQSQIVEWACELLDALCYLHSRPPHGILHSDIKPSNIMITPQKEIRLIDFNIALALGDEGAVRVGFSRGYASPEHFGIDYTQGGNRTTEDAFARSRTRQESTRRETRGNSQATVLLPNAPVLHGSAAARSSVQSTSGEKTVLLDVRSDIYSLGATLYHALTGERPAVKATEVKPISSFQNRNISPAVAAIISRAMDPNPDRRFQTAKEMLDAFEHLHDRDPRARRHRRHIAFAAVLTALIALTGGAMAYVGLRQAQREDQAIALALQSKEKLEMGDVDAALELALSAIPEEPGLLDPPPVPAVQRAVTNALGVYDLSDGYKAHRVLSLPASPIKVALSQEGSRAAALCDGKILVFDTETGTELASLMAEPSVLSDFLFRDVNTLLFAGTEGLTAWDIEENRELWHTGQPATAVALSEDGLIAASAFRDASTASIWNVRTGELVGTVDFGDRKMPVLPSDVFGDRKDNLFALDETGAHLAVSFTDGSLSVFSIGYDGEQNTLGRDGLNIFPPSDYVHFDGGFYQGFFASAASAPQKTAFVLYDLTYTDGPLIDSEGQRPYHIQADQSGILFSVESNIVELNPYAETAEEVQKREAAHLHTEVASFVRKGERILVVGTDGSYSLFDNNAREIAALHSVRRIDFALFGGDYLLLANRDTPSLEVRKWVRTAPLFRYDAEYEHMEARVHTEGGTALLWGYGTIRVVDEAGQIVAETAVRDAGQDYDFQYRRPGDKNFQGLTVTDEGLEILYKDGHILWYNPKTAELLSEDWTDPPPENLYEEFETKNYRVTNPLHETPQVYDHAGKYLGELEADGELTYVTEWGEYLIVEYMTLAGERYAHLLNRSLQVVADLPKLCDFLPEGTLVFDDMAGSLRATPVRTLDELTTMARLRR